MSTKISNPIMKLKIRKNQNRQILSTDKIILINEPNTKKFYIILVQKSCTKSVFYYVIQSLFNQNVTTYF